MFCAAGAFAVALSAAVPHPADSLPVKAEMPPADSAGHGARDTLTPGATAKSDSLPAAGKSDSLKAAADSAVHPFAPTWPADSTDLVCRDPLEVPEDCWRTSLHWADQDIGFPGARAGLVSLASLEQAAPQSFYQPALAASPYRWGGSLPWDRVDTLGRLEEVWTPVLPVDTPVTSIHWMRGALGTNQFTLNLRRMVGNRAYLALQFHSDQSDSGYYNYSFNVHQPYLSGWGFLGQIYHPIKRDSASLVISDTAQGIDAQELRPRLGFWIDSQTVVEAFADWLHNASSLTMPTNAADNDSNQLLYPASFSLFTAGGVAAHRSASALWRLGVWNSTWDRSLQPVVYDSAESASGTQDRAQGEVVSQTLPGRPRARVTLVSNREDGALRLHGAGDALAANAWGDSESLDFDAHPRTGPVAATLRAGGGRRSRPDGKTEWLGGADGDLHWDLPVHFQLTAGTGWRREGAPEDWLFRWDPELDLYPNPDLRPRSDWSSHVGTAWNGSRLGVGASWDRNRYGDNWLPRVLPRADFCAHSDASDYPLESQPLCPDGNNVPDSLALQRVNYAEETRDVVHLSLYFLLGRWKLSLDNTYLLNDALRDPHLGVAQRDLEFPDRIFKGQLFWHRKLIDDRMDLQTEWDWEWFATRYAFASIGDGLSEPLKLDEYLVLDFTARMQIKSFVFYFRAMNFNHDRYATEPGVHPPGVNFRFGIDWTLWN